MLTRVLHPAHLGPPPPASVGDAMSTDTPTGKKKQMTLFGTMAEEAEPTVSPNKMPKVKKTRAPKKRRARRVRDDETDNDDEFWREFEAEATAEEEAKEASNASPLPASPLPASLAAGFPAPGTAVSVRSGGDDSTTDDMGRYTSGAFVAAEEVPYPAASSVASSSTSLFTPQHQRDVIASSKSGASIGLHQPVSWPTDQPVCRNCLVYVDTLQAGVRLCCKNPPQFKCPKCCSKTVSLTKLCGSWPTEEFLQLDSMQQTAFWQEEGSDMTSIKKHYEKHVVRHLIHRKQNQQSGDYLPLSVWKAKGFDTQNIEKCAASELHPVLGPTYQVNIHTTSEAAVDEQVHTMMTTTFKKTKKTPQVPKIEDDDAAPAPPEEPLATQDSTVTKSDSSSSSSSSEKKKKSKQTKRAKDKKAKKAKDKKDKKAKEKEKKEREAARKRQREREIKEREDAAALKKRRQRAQTDSSRIISKVTPILTSLKADMANAGYKNVPKVISDKVKKSVSTLATMHEKCSVRIGNAFADDLDFTADESIDAVKEGMILDRAIWINIFICIVLKTKHLFLICLQTMQNLF